MQKVEKTCGRMQSSNKKQQIHKLQPSEKTVLQFNPEKIEQTDVEFNGRKTKRYQYTVTEPNSGSNQEKYLTVGKTTSEEIDSHLRRTHITQNSKIWLRQGYTVPRNTSIEAKTDPFIFLRLLLMCI